MLITIRMQGGLGNQMCQHALAREFQHQGKRVVLDLCSYRNNQAHNGFELMSVFPSISHRVIKSPWRRAFNRIGSPRVNESAADFDSEVFKIKKGVLRGYWQSPHYFASATCQLRKDFEFRGPLDGENADLAGKIALGPSVSLHVRRGDYVGHSMFEGICTADYYRRALEALQTRVGRVHVFLFSDDIDWCVDHLELPDLTTPVSWNRGQNSFRDMQLMSLCNHHIVANSSFSWWGAWLNSHPEKMVFAPDKWIHGKDMSSLILPEWHVIASSAEKSGHLAGDPLSGPVQRDKQIRS